MKNLICAIFLALGSYAFSMEHEADKICKLREEAWKLRNHTNTCQKQIKGAEACLSKETLLSLSQYYKEIHVTLDSVKQSCDFAIAAEINNMDPQEVNYHLQSAWCMLTKARSEFHHYQTNIRKILGSKPKL